QNPWTVDYRFRKVAVSDRWCIGPLGEFDNFGGSFLNRRRHDLLAYRLGCRSGLGQEIWRGDCRSRVLDNGLMGGERGSLAGARGGRPSVFGRVELEAKGRISRTSRTSPSTVAIQAR